ncbi:MAG: hypothetical protein AMXMBFR37_07020 [Steroidobacteraceae bacterium]
MKVTHLWLIGLILALGACGGAGPPPHSSSGEGQGDDHRTEHENAKSGEDGHAAEEGEHAAEESEHGADEGESGSVKLSAGHIKTAGITVLAAGPATVREALPVYGSVAPNAERVRDVVARFPGVIKSATKRIGEEVRQGETLARVESNESLQTYALVAPLSGVVTSRNANPGEQSGDKVLFTIADLSTVWVELALFPRDLSKVRVGQMVRVKGVDSGISGDGKIVYVAPFGSSANQTLTARVQLDNKHRQWAPGLYVTAEIALSEAQVPLAVRSEALQTLDGNTVVFVQNDEGFEARRVSTGRTDGQWVEILDGVKPGEMYAAKNSFIVKAELGKGAAEHGH